MRSFQFSSGSLRQSAFTTSMPMLMWPRSFATNIPRDLEARFRRAHFPELTAVVNQNTGDQQITIESGVSCAKRIGAPHHLRGMPKQTAPKGMMVSPGGGSSTKARAELRQE